MPWFLRETLGKNIFLFCPFCCFYLQVSHKHTEASSISTFGIELGSNLSMRCHLCSSYPGFVIGLGPCRLLRLCPYPLANVDSAGPPEFLCYVYIPAGTRTKFLLQEITEVSAKIPPLPKRPFSERGDPRQRSSSLASFFGEQHSIDRPPFRGKVLLPSLVPYTLDGGIHKCPHHSCFSAAPGKNLMPPSLGLWGWVGWLSAEGSSCPLFIVWLPAHSMLPVTQGVRSGGLYPG